MNTTQPVKHLTRCDEGYRYIESYRGKSWEGFRYALWERRNGRMRRVGTARTQQEATNWLLTGGKKSDT